MYELTVPYNIRQNLGLLNPQLADQNRDKMSKQFRKLVSSLIIDKYVTL